MSILHHTFSSPLLRPARRPPHHWWAKASLTGLLLLVFALAGCGPPPWQNIRLTDIRGALPDLEFNLKTAGGRTITQQDLRGKIVILYFGYTHCPDVCPMTLGHLAAAIKQLEPAERDDVRILFISVDPKRDTPELVEQYARAFSPEAIGVVGTPDQTEQLAKRYRIAYQAEKPDAHGNYEVMHSKAVYIFNRRGRIDLLGTDTNTADDFAHDLKLLLHSSS